MNPVQRERHFTRKEAAAYLGVTTHSFARWASEKSGPAYYKLGGKTWYRQCDLDEFVESRRRGGQSV